MADFSEIGTEVERQLSKLGEDIRQFVGKIIPVAADEEGFAPACDIAESETEFKILIDLPGLSKKEISVSLKDNVLTIKGEREIILDEGEEFKRRERKSGAFVRSFALPETADKTRIDAGFRNGVLRITVQKSDNLKDLHSIPVK